MARSYEILVRVNLGAPEHYEDFYGTQDGIERVIARLNAIFSVYGTRTYTYRIANEF